ncbi:MAG TPA: hypothetical protein DHW02_02355 [Ktedonobacter sp.]|nr:hypothetical protein [Ktedonobacter sp.]
MKRLICPCCGQKRNVTNETPLIQVQKIFSHACLTHENWAEYYAEGSFYHWGGMQWACNYCMREGIAIEGKPHLQMFCDYPPYLAYFDKTYTCSDCLNAFIFNKEEQRYWYEELKFWVQSYPKQCLECRRKRRKKSI